MYTKLFFVMLTLSLSWSALAHPPLFTYPSDEEAPDVYTQARFRTWQAERRLNRKIRQLSRYHLERFLSIRETLEEDCDPTPEFLLMVLRNIQSRPEPSPFEIHV